MSLYPGFRLAHYEVIAPLGTGGMGEVYRARDVRLGRTVALKVLPPELAGDDAYRERFEREARAASALSHPNIAHVYDVGQENGTHFIAMEYVEGENLRAHCAGRTLPADRVVDIGIQLASALEEAHARGIVHRDIKPANAVLTPKGLVKVLDFGLARQARPTGAAVDSELSTEAHTQAGVVLGTVPYMSPEQALGKDVDTRTDLFSLGVLLYELAAGRLPFAGRTAAERIDNICHATPEPISASNPALPEELERIVRKCLEKDRERRYATARDLVVDLRNLQRDRDSGASAARAAAPRRSLRRPIGAAAGLFVLLALGAATWRWLPRGSPGIDSIAVLPFRNESGNPEVEYLSDGITESLINGLSRLPDLRVISRTSAFAFKEKQGDLRAIGRALGVNALLLGRMVQRGKDLAISAELVEVAGDRQLWGARYDRQLGELLAIEREITEAVARKLRPSSSAATTTPAVSRGGTSDPEAYQLYLRGQHFVVGTSAEMSKALDLLQQAVGRDPNYALAHAAVAGTLILRVEHGEADPREAVPAAKAALERARAVAPDLADAHIIAGKIQLLFDWDWAAADAEYRRAVESAPGSALSYLEYADYLWAMGRYEEALAASKRGLELDPISRIAMHHVAFTHLASRNYAAAEAGFLRALEVHPNWIWGHTKLSVTYAFSGRPKEALASVARAEALLKDGGGTPLLRAWLGAAYAKAGDEASARASLRRLEQLAKSRPVDPTFFATVRGALGETDTTLGLLEQAYREHSLWMPFVPQLFLFDDLRSEPRFRKLVADLAMPAAVAQGSRLP